VENSNLAGLTVEAIPARAETGVIVCRHRGAGDTNVRAATGDTNLQLGDVIMVVGTHSMLDRFQCVVGRQSDEDLRLAPGNIADRQIVVTHKDVLGKTVGELALDARCGAVVSRITRANIELTAVPGLRLQFGDTVQAIGDQASLERAEMLLGNSVKDLNETQFVPMFIGIVLGIIAGTILIVLPGLAQPLQLGLAGRWLSRWCLDVSDTSGVSCSTCQRTRTSRSANSASPCFSRQSDWRRDRSSSEACSAPLACGGLAPACA
jgi:putative transport protein